ncbi:MAG: class I SAM-dependent methyltransferase [Pseudomonadota bacterium]|nr:class I SAM-dependent methyltransferase [Pseudomonadota bacterium]
MTAHAQEASRGDRFEFGANWARFLSLVNEDRIAQAENSLKDMLGVSNLQGKRFLDIGSGSGLFSLAARRLGGVVHSLDYDPKSVGCTQELKRRYFAGDGLWLIEKGSVLDRAYLARLGQFDVVYSWGVLHHTGAMWQALENVAPLVADGGQLFIAIYNDQGTWSKRWRVLKRIYNVLPRFARKPYALTVMAPRELKFLAIFILKGRPWGYFSNILNYSKHNPRGMSYWHDLIDWIGGYPFEVATLDTIFHFYRDRGFVLSRLHSCYAGGHGCNEFVFVRGSRLKGDEA